MNLLFEIGCEELPASAVDLAVSHLPAALKSALESARISVGNIESFGTPRRLIVHAQNLAHKQEDLSTEVQGPRAEVAFNADGSLTQAGLGFLNGRKIDPQNAYAKETPKGKVLAAQVHETGERTAVVLAKLLPEIMAQIPFAKTMRWESSKARFSRPVRWLLCLLGDQVIGFEYAGVQSSNKTCGHRFLGAEFNKVTEKTYFDFLTSHHVIFDKAKRKEMIATRSRNQSAEPGVKIQSCLRLLRIWLNTHGLFWVTLIHTIWKFHLKF
jgi:glycyl-tRNA synthetase beta chain